MSGWFGGVFFAGRGTPRRDVWAKKKARPSTSLTGALGKPEIQDTKGTRITRNSKVSTNLENFLGFRQSTTLQNAKWMGDGPAGFNRRHPQGSRPRRQGIGYQTIRRVARGGKCGSSGESCKINRRTPARPGRGRPCVRTTASTAPESRPPGEDGARTAAT